MIDPSQAQGNSAEGIKAGDVLLFRGSSFISRAIRFFDGADVNHAAIVVDHEQLAEAAGSGLRLFGIDESLRSNERTYVCRLKLSDSLAPVVEVADRYVSQRLPYAYQQILLLGLLSLTRRLPIESRIFRKVLRTILDQAARVLNGLLDSGNELMICSEFVYRCFDEAASGEPDPYRLDIPVMAPPPPTGEGLRTGVASPAGPAQPGSLLLELEQEPTPPRLSGEPQGTPGDVDQMVKDAEDEIERVLQSSAADLWGGPSPEQPLVAAEVPEEVTEDDVEDSARRFARALQRNAISRTPSRAAAGETLSLLETVADFVTPGDLLRTPSLDAAIVLP